MGRAGDALLRDERPPGDVSSIERREFWKELLANARAQAVGTDQDRCRGGRTFGEMRDHAAVARLDAGERHAAMIAIGRKGVAEHTKQSVPRGQGLRTFGFSDHSAGAVQGPPPAHFDPELDVGIEPQGTEHGAQLRLRYDPGAAAGELAGHVLEHFDVPSAARERQRGEQPAHRAADHERAPRAPHVCLPEPCGSSLSCQRCRGLYIDADRSHPRE